MHDALQPYPEYKDSGLPWLGKIPKEWKYVPFWTVARQKSEIGQPRLGLLSVYLDRGVIPYSEGGGLVHAPSLDLSKYQVVQPGNLVLNNQQAWRGSVGVSRYTGIVSPAYMVFTLADCLNWTYSNYLFRSPAMVDQFKIASRGVGTIQRNIYPPSLRVLNVPVPPLEDQIAIASYLAHANQRIDRYIRAKQKLIKLLNEQKQAIIHHAVTRGLDPTVPLKPSGIPWLGDIPAHWEVKRIKYLLREVDSRSITGAETLLSMRMHHGLVPFAEHYTRPPQSATLVGFKLVYPGQFVVNRMQAGNGLIFASHLMGLVSPDYAVFDVISEVNVDFLGELFRSRKVRAKFRAESKGLGTGSSGFLRLYSDRLGSIHIALPPRAEQDTILSTLNDQLADTNAAIAHTEHQIALIREYRTRLIADIVTGQLDVRAAAQHLPDPEAYTADAPLPVDEDLPTDDLDPTTTEADA